MEFTNEQIQQARECKTLEEFKEKARAAGLNIPDEKAEEYFKATRVGSLSDDDLDAVAGGKGDGEEKETIPEPLYHEGQSVYGLFLRNGWLVKLKAVVVSKAYKENSWRYVCNSESVGSQELYESQIFLYE